MGTSFGKVNKAVEAHASDGVKVLDVLKIVKQTSKEVQEGSGHIHEQGTFIHKEMNALETISAELTKAVSEIRTSEQNVQEFLGKAREIASHKE